MRLRNVTLDDLDLYYGMLCDPEVMAELGGPLPDAGIPAKVASDVVAVERDDAWILAIVPDDTSGLGVGTICVWESERDGEPLNEIGWMLLKQHQGQGLGSEAVRLTLLRAKATSRWGVIHAFPGVTNPASNAICRKLGFTFMEECDVTYGDRPLRVNHWRLDLSTWDTRKS